MQNPLLWISIFYPNEQCQILRMSENVEWKQEDNGIKWLQKAVISSCFYPNARSGCMNCIVLLRNAMQTYFIVFNKFNNFAKTIIISWTVTSISLYQIQKLLWNTNKNKYVIRTRELFFFLGMLLQYCSNNLYNCNELF